MPLTAQQALTKVQALHGVLTGRRTEIARLESYFDGKHKLAYATDEWRKLHEGRYRGFSDNWCKVVGSAPGKRTAVTGFRLPANKSFDPLTDDEQQLWSDWDMNDLPAQSAQGFLTTSVAARSAVLVWGDDDDEPVVTWEHPSQVAVEYDRTVGRIRRAALKAWAEGDREYATLYTPDHVWKFERPVSQHPQVVNGQTQSGLHVVGATSFTPGGSDGWVARDVPEDDVWPLVNPLGVVPIVEFRRTSTLGSEPTSKIDGTVAMQDAINMLWAYLFVAADHASMPARVIMGQEPPKIPILDETGKKIGERPVDSAALTRGRMLWLTGEKTTVGQWDAAKLDVFTDVINVAVRHVAAQTSTPIYLIHGELGNVNGDTLTGLDAPLVNEVREDHTAYRSPVQEVFSMMALVRGNKAIAQACRAGAVGWRHPETQNDAQVSDAALKDRQVGWPFQAVLERRYNLTQDEVQRYVEMAKAERDDPELERMVRELSGGPAPVDG